MVRTKNVSFPFDDAGPSKRKVRFDDTALTEQRYTKLFSHSATGIHERGLSLDPEGHSNLDQAMSAIVDAFGWAKFIKAPAMAGHLSTGQPIDAAQIIMNQMTAVARRRLPLDNKPPNAPSLPFPRLITALCRRAKVEFPTTKVPLKTQGPINPASLGRSGGRAEEQYHRAQMATIDRNHRHVMGELDHLRRQGAHHQECIEVINQNLHALQHHREGTDTYPACRPLPPPLGGLH
ncbi:uncharacterized protein G2W53_037120 [Senna tora]|uniref:Uncharacterized protein n=1 Tax=Senna tora TaxID=362788 RepID=A0A834SYN5_9FABA|nr:uncharacterized protein G2W53_037120 [Senna tora]